MYIVKVTAQEYSKMADKASPPSAIFKNMLLAFLCGGGICTLGQLLFDLYTRYCGMSVVHARAVVSITLIFLSALFTGLNVYDKFALVAGAGSLVPITGFANAVVAPAIEFKPEGHVMGIGVKMFSIAGPVLVFGITTSVLYGVILYVFGMF